MEADPEIAEVEDSRKRLAGLKGSREKDQRIRNPSLYRVEFICNSIIFSNSFMDSNG